MTLKKNQQTTNSVQNYPVVMQRERTDTNWVYGREIFWPRGYKKFILNSTEKEIYHAHKFTCMGMINTTTESLKVRKVIIFHHFSFMSSSKFMLS